MSNATEFYSAEQLLGMFSIENPFWKCSSDINKKFIQRFALGQRFSGKESNDVAEIHIYLDQILKTGNFDLFLLYVSNQDKPVEKSSLNDDLLEFQNRLVIGRIDIIIFRLFTFYFLIFNTINKPLHTQIITKCIDILTVFTYDN